MSMMTSYILEFEDSKKKKKQPKNSNILRTKH